jgi:hypothetical protein
MTLPPAIPTSPVEATQRQGIRAIKNVRAFAMTEVLVAIALAVFVVVLIGVLVNAAATAWDKDMRGNQTRNIMVWFSMWSDANSAVRPMPNPATQPVCGDLPGSLPMATGNYPANATDPSVVARFWALIAAPGIDPLDPRMLVNLKRGGVPETVWSNANFTVTRGVTTVAAAGFASNNVSYALLSTRMGSEWRNNSNAGCPMICDRNRGTPAAAASSWSTRTWVGHVAWGDCHYTFEHSPIFSVTIYGKTIPNNNLWAPATSSNAGMVDPGE